jgi:hypothetical protein
LRQLEAQLTTSSSTSRYSNTLDTRNLATSPFTGDDDVILSPSHGPSFLLEDRAADQWGGISDGEYLLPIYLPNYLSDFVAQDLSQPSMPVKLDRSKMDNQGKKST